MTELSKEEKEEQIYLRGSRSAWLFMLAECMKQLGYDSKEVDPHRWIRERQEAISVLRGLCEELGDNEWDEDLHLADIIDKHLGRHLL